MVGHGRVNKNCIILLPCFRTYKCSAFISAVHLFLDIRACTNIRINVQDQWVIIKAIGDNTGISWIFDIYANISHNRN